MDKKQFKLLVDKTLGDILDYLEQSEQDLDIDDREGVISFTDGKLSCIINYHPVSKEIWFASSINGAYHFVFDKVKENWISTKGEELFSIIKKELKTDL